VSVGCAPPIRVRPADADTVHRTLTGNVLSSGSPSLETKNTLYRRDLHDRYDKDPAAALADLHAIAVGPDGDSRDLLALAELSFQHGRRSNDRRYYVAAMVYAYAYLFPGGEAEPPSAFEQGTRLAADLYNRGFVEGGKLEAGKPLDLHAGTYEASFGPLEVDVDRSGFVWGNRELVEFTPVADLEVQGLRNRYRQQGIGAPLAATSVARVGTTGPQIQARRARVPATVLVRIEDPRGQLATSHVRGVLELYPAFAASRVVIDGREIPLEVERTATLAYELSDTPIWKRELRGFFGQPPDEVELPSLSSLEPYQRGRIPVVFVHGTASSPGRWAEMVNELEADDRIRDHYFFVFFFYDTGNPIAYSAMGLRDLMTEAVTAADPDGDDPCVQDIVVIGHSQGGLLAKMTAIESGSRFWDSISDVPFEQVDFDPQVRALVHRALFIEPLPAVKRIIFIATPHRGSFVASKRISHWLTRMVRFPSELLAVGAETLRLRDSHDYDVRSHRMSTSVDDMTPGSRFIRNLDAMPVVDGVATHSIIAVKGDGPIETGNDGVVEYSSAHLDGVESELVVRSSHSTQGNPHTIAEVRRILLEHLDETECPGPAAIAAPGPRASP